MFRSKYILLATIIPAAFVGYYFYSFFMSVAEPDPDKKIINSGEIQAKENNFSGEIIDEEIKNREKEGSSGDKNIFSVPMDQAEKRISKKTFGQYITPETSPVKPDKFRGYHTGTDWEIFPEEMELPVPVRAVCSGNLKIKKFASGYGGVVVEECALDNEPITVIYGHMKLSSVSKSAGQKLTAGEIIGVLGNHESAETDGARKHLHLAIHRGNNLDLKGYVDARPKLADWSDPCLSGCCAP